MRRAGSGDPSAQRLVVARLMRRVQRLSKALIRQRDDASDASQASLLEILRCAASYRAESSLERWADRIVVRTALRQARAGRRVSVTPLEALPSPSVSPSADPTITTAEYLDLLPERQRTALVLRCAFEYTVEEIAELTQSSPNTVKDRLKRAREAVRHALRRDDATTDLAAVVGRNR